MNKKHSLAISFVIIFLVFTTIMQYMLPMGHNLWMTAFAFILGSYTGVYGRARRISLVVTVMAISILFLLSLNLLFNHKELNYYLILIAAISIVGFLLNGRLPRIVLNKLLALSGCIIQIYFIHTYLFLRHVTNIPLVDYTITMFVILIVAYFLSQAAAKLNSVQIQRILPTHIN
jgi:hypothetical protein